MAEQLERARGLLESGQPAEALLHLRLAKASPGPPGEVRYLMGLAHLGTQDVAAAVDDLMAASRGLPDDPAVETALQEALGRLMEPSAEERAAAEEALERLTRSVVGEEARPPDEPALPPGAGEDVAPAEARVGEEAELEELLRRIADSCATEDVGFEPPLSREEEAEPPVLDLALIREELARSGARRGGISPRTILMRGRTSQTRKTALWTTAFFLVGALAFGGIAKHRAGYDPVRGAVPAKESERASGASGETYESRASAPATAATGEAGDAVPEKAAPGGEASPIEPAAPALDRQPVPGASEEGPQVPRPEPGSQTGAVPDPRGPANAPASQPSRSDSSAGSGSSPGYAYTPRYEFMSRVGLFAPPGGVLDPANSDARRLVVEGLPPKLRAPLVLTFRTTATVEQVAEFYRGSGGLRFNTRVVPMGGKYQGVERTVARASGRVAGGHEATLTISRPGVDPASKKLIPQTTVRIEIF